MAPCCCRPPGGDGARAIKVGCLDEWKFAPEDSAYRLDQLDQLYQLDQQNESPMEEFCFKKIHLHHKKLIFALGTKVFFVFEI